MTCLNPQQEILGHMSPLNDSVIKIVSHLFKCFSFAQYQIGCGCYIISEWYSHSGIAIVLYVYFVFEILYYVKTRYFFGIFCSINGIILL